MAQQHIGTGTVDNDGTGDTLKAAMVKTEANFTDLYTQIGGKADLASPTFTGTPSAPTAAPGTNTTQLATTAFVTAAVTGLLDFKGATNASGNPNYPAALKGDAYVISAAGKIGGASGLSVDIGDVYVASADNAGGTQAAVGTSWFILEHNLAGALLAANNLSDLANAATARTNLGVAIGANVQAWDTDLDAIAALSASNDDFIQRKAGAWANRTIAQVRADLAAGYILAKSAVQVSHTGDTLEFTAATIAIPASAIGLNGQVEAIALFTGTNSANTKTYRVKFGGTAFFSAPVTATPTIQSYTRVANRNATNSQVGTGTGGAQGMGAQSSAPTTAAVDTTAIVNIDLTVQLTNSSETATLESYLIRIIPG